MTSQFHFAKSDSGFSLIEILTAVGLATVLLISATKMLNTSIERTEKHVSSDMDAKVLGSFTSLFSRLTTRSQISSLFWHRPINLMQSCHDEDLILGCGLIINDSQDSKSDHPSCIHDIPSNLNIPYVQLFSNKTTFRRSIASSINIPSVDQPITIDQFIPSDLNELNDIHAYAAWKLHPQNTTVPELTMVSRSYKKKMIFFLPQRIGNQDIDFNTDNNSQPMASVVVQASRILKTGFYEDLAKKLNRTIAVVHSVLNPRIYSLVYISSIEQCTSLPPQQNECTDIINTYYNPDQPITPEDFTDRFFIMGLEPLSNIEEHVTPFVLGDKDDLDSSAILTSFENIINQSHFNLNLSSIFEVLSTPPDGLLWMGDRSIPWTQRLPHFNYFLMKHHTNDSLAIVPANLMKLRLTERKFEKQTPDGLKENSDEDTMAKSVHLIKFHLNEKGDPAHTVRPILSNISPSYNDQTRIYKNKDVIIARQLHSKSHTLTAIIGVLDELRCDVEN